MARKTKATNRSATRSSRSLAPPAGSVGVIYARYSSHNQKDASIEQQVAECMQYAAGRGLHISDTYADRAITGKTDQRPRFQQMMRDAEKGMFQFVLAWKSNRMGRNMLQAMVNEARLNDLGIRVFYVEEDFDDTAAGRFALRSMMNVNQFYSENMAEDVRRGLMDNALQAKAAGPLPYGYKTGPDLRYEIDTPKDEIVREIYSRVAAGETMVSIAKDLNARGIPTNSGGCWNKNSFHKIILNERYRGIYIWSDIRIEGAIPRIVSDDLYFRTQEALNMKKSIRGRHNPNGDYLLTGKLFCGHCKSAMIGVSGTSKTGDLHYYYTCQKKRTGHSCNKKNVRRDFIEQTVARAIVSYCLRDDIIEIIADKTIEHNKRRLENSEAAILRSELESVQSSIKNLMKAIEAGIITETTRSRLLELESQQAQLRSKIAAAEADIIPIERDDLIAGLMMFRDGNVQSKKFQAKLFDTFLRAVYLYDDHLKIVFTFTGSENSVTLPASELSGISEEIDSIGESILGEKVRLSSPLVNQKASVLRNRSFFLSSFKTS